MKPERIQSEATLMTAFWRPILPGVVHTATCTSFGEAAHLGRHVERLARPLGVESCRLSLNENNALTIQVLAPAGKAGLGEAEKKLLGRIEGAVEDLLDRSTDSADPQDVI